MDVEEKPLVLYDIASGPPRRTFAPNPWKARLTLNFKSAPYSTHWVELPDVESTRRSLGVPPSRQFPDGSDFYTLPIVYDSTANKYVGDTFEIALYLDEKYPHGPKLIPHGTAGITKAWNERVDVFFSRFAGLFAPGTPLNPDNAEECRQILVNRGQHFMGKGQILTWEDCIVTGDKRVKTLAEFKVALGEFETYYKYAPEGEGPFLNGKTPTYADIIVGGWLGYAHATLPAGELADFQTWHHGRWGDIWKSLQKLS